ncbi:hypothetical protein BIY28_02235 [Brenneria goodwinii]|nr:hypothetical protein BIY28_02235 [Brenneria goodwinii]
MSADFAGENGFDAFEIFDIEFSWRVVAIQVFNPIGADAINQSLFKGFLRPASVTITADTLSGRIVQIECQPRTDTATVIMPAIHCSTKFQLRHRTTTDTGLSCVVQANITIKSGLCFTFPIATGFQHQFSYADLLSLCSRLFTMDLLIFLFRALASPFRLFLSIGCRCRIVIKANDLPIAGRMKTLAA